MNNAEKVKLIGAFKTIKEWCENTECDDTAKCPFGKNSVFCEFRKGEVPCYWEIEESKGWDVSDASMAKMLLSSGATHIFKNSYDGYVYWGGLNAEFGKLPKGTFNKILPGETIQLISIIREYENGKRQGS